MGNAMGRGHITDPGDVPPWQRGPAARAAEHAAPVAAGANPPGAPSRQRPLQATPPVVDARLNRFISGGSAAPARHRKSPTRRPRAASRYATSRRVSEAYASELPDLSGAIPRSPQRKVAPERTEPPARAASPGRVQVANRPHAGPVRASMQIRRIDPWSALKVSLVLSVALFFVWMIAVAFLYLVLGGMGVWSKLNSNVGDLLTSAGGRAAANWCPAAPSSAAPR